MSPTMQLIDRVLENPATAPLLDAEAAAESALVAWAGSSFEDSWNRLPGEVQSFITECDVAVQRDATNAGTIFTYVLRLPRATRLMLLGMLCGWKRYGGVAYTTAYIRRANGDMRESIVELDALMRAHAPTHEPLHQPGHVASPPLTKAGWDEERGRRGRTR